MATRKTKAAVPDVEHVQAAPYIKAINSTFNKAGAALVKYDETRTAFGEKLIEVQELIRAKKLYINDERVTSFAEFLTEHTDFKLGRTTAYQYIKFANEGPKAIEDAREAQRVRDDAKVERLAAFLDAWHTLTEAEQAEHYGPMMASDSGLGLFGGSTATLEAARRAWQALTRTAQCKAAKSIKAPLAAAAAQAGTVRDPNNSKAGNGVDPEDSARQRGAVYEEPKAEGSTSAASDMPVVEAPALTPEAEPEPPALTAEEIEDGYLEDFKKACWATYGKMTEPTRNKARRWFNNDYTAKLTKAYAKAKAKAEAQKEAA